MAHNISRAEKNSVSGNSSTQGDKEEEDNDRYSHSYTESQQLGAFDLHSILRLVRAELCEENVNHTNNFTKTTFTYISTKKTLIMVIGIQAQS